MPPALQMIENKKREVENKESKKNFHEKKNYSLAHYNQILQHLHDLILIVSLLMVILF